MKRRNFFTASGLAAAGTVAHAASPEEDLFRHDLVERSHNLTLRCQQATEGDYPEIELRLALKREKPEAQWEDSISRFELMWEGRSIEIAKRFWDDLRGLVIETYPVEELAKLPADKRSNLEWKLRDLFCPRMVLSQDKGTVFIEWVIPQECDGRSTIRWMISKNGIVLRNRETPFHEC